jgi:hypothetical protein
MSKTSQTKNVPNALNKHSVALSQLEISEFKQAIDSTFKPFPVMPWGKCVRIKNTVFPKSTACYIY